MRKRSAATGQGWKGGVRALGLALTLGFVGSSPARADDVGHTPVAATAAPRAHAGTSLEDRVQILAKALNLDATQQSELRMALVSQREQVMRVWNDPAVPPAYRISATRAISEQTSDRIRGFLNDEQRAKFNPPRQAHEQDPDASVRSVEDWMKAPEPN